MTTAEFDELPLTTWAALDKVRDARRANKPQSTRNAIAHAMLTLPYEELAEFTRHLRIMIGEQSAAALPEKQWQMDDTGTGGYFATTAELLPVLRSAFAYSISWPSVYDHWGIMIRIVHADNTESIIRSTDWQLTETYLSS